MPMPSTMKTNRKINRKMGKRSKKSDSGFALPLRSIMPLHLRGELPYTTTVTLSASAGTFTDYVFRTTSIYDPDLTGTGTVAAMYTQLAALYQLYRVHGARVNIDYINTTAVPAQVGFYVNANSTSLPNFVSIGIQPLSWLSVIDGTGGNGHISRKFTFKAHDVLGVTKAQYSAGSEFWSAINANPLNGCYGHVGVASFTASSVVIQFTITIIMDVEFTEPKNRGMA